ncbi:hypothetical protein [Ascidiaceihabitans sp.]|uniref:hypothetical protein n=1 Tax=Ascidiaceihabitans sp. TaxID=1872644 RepID=UPI00329896E2
MLLHDIRDQCVYDCAFVGKKLVDCSDWNTGALYASAYFISSKIHSYFSDFPMPDYYPNYPSNRQIFDYMKNFARHYNLYDHITFNTEVTQTTFANDVWDVTLAHRETRQYRWMVCVSGTTWHPKMPAWASQTDAFDGEVRHANSFRHMDEFRGKRVWLSVRVIPVVTLRVTRLWRAMRPSSMCGAATILYPNILWASLRMFLATKAPMLHRAAAARAMQQRRSGYIFSIMSMAAMGHMKDSAAYSASKLGQKKKQAFLQRFQTK